jgi:hypothetical protein
MYGTKEQVRRLLDRLPDDCSLDDVLYHLYIIQEVEKGRDQAKAGNLIPQEEVEKELRSRWQIGRAE